MIKLNTATETVDVVKEFINFDISPNSFLKDYLQRIMKKQ